MESYYYQNLAFYIIEKNNSKKLKKDHFFKSVNDVTL